MGVNPTSLFKTFTFDGASSGTYGAFLTGEGVFNAPERSVEMLEIPGRNGGFALDQGKFENVELTYKGGLVDYTESDFSNRMSSLRNWLCSKIGYVRLEDDYNPDEYRMAVFKDGLDVDHIDLLNGEFDLTFECKPQRWLKSGESAVAVANNGTLSNPTLFPSSPLLAVKGYGNISFNGFSIDVQNVTLGDVVMVDEAYSLGLNLPQSFVIDTSVVNTGDNVSLVFDIADKYTSPVDAPHGKYAVTNIGDPVYSNIDFSFVSANAVGKAFTLNSRTNCQIVVGTNSTQTNTVTGTFTVKNSVTNVSWTNTYIITQTVQYVAGTQTVTVSSSGTMTTTLNGNTYQTDSDKLMSANITANSTVSALGNPTYIDCDIGECYMIKNDNVITLNGVISFGSQLPTLASGSNTFTYDNTITELKVTPRWWRV